MSDPRPILFFDSGVGGLSIAAPTRAAVPQARFVYVADSAGFPYGIKDEAEIAARVPALLGRVAERYNPRLIVIACNTASTIALAAVRNALDIPIVGTVPAIKPAAERSRTRTIGVLGTAATVRQAYVDDLAARFAGDCRVIRHGSAELVTLAEAKLRGESVSVQAVKTAIAPMLAAPDAGSLDTVALACTHFPLLADELAAAFGPAVSFVDGGPGIARRVASLTHGQSFARTAPDVAVFTGPIGTGLEQTMARYEFARCTRL
ncbi:glutamate racemase [Sphingomonas mucosissima]|uniref:Glutamate racemase n=1 Tax=Sphingomonas mucosissima TaxID=370959 RepID=A0A245ZJ57_9SPHN|nr:glutamate racemase [Sphingomonas mucosissima]OWK29769.1 glutamate racemase [Sphingomonas mucosissima]